MNFLTYGLLAWVLVIATAVASIAFRRFVQWWNTPRKRPPAPQPRRRKLSRREAVERVVGGFTHEHEETLEIIDSLPLPDEDRQSLALDEEERLNIYVRNALNDPRLRGNVDVYETEGQ